MRQAVTITGVFNAPYKNPDGSWTFDMSVRELTITEADTLVNLFPDLTEAAYKLLAKQAVLNAIR